MQYIKLHLYHVALYKLWWILLVGFVCAASERERDAAQSGYYLGFVCAASERERDAVQSGYYLGFVCDAPSRQLTKCFSSW